MRAVGWLVGNKVSTFQANHAKQNKHVGQASFGLSDEHCKSELGRLLENYARDLFVV